MVRLIRGSAILLLLLASLWSTGTFGEIPERAVVINEIAWAGTAAGATDEWIELYNRTDEEIDLAGWRLVSDDGSPDIILSGTIPAHGFFLLERGDDNTVSDIPADQIYRGSLDNDGERLSLLDPQGNLVDTANHDGGPWPAGTDAHGSPAYASMERVAPEAEDRDENWVSNDGTRTAGYDAQGNPLNGTPKAPNSAYNLPPQAAFTFSPQRPVVGQAVDFDASPSQDPDGEIVQWLWNFGDGTAGEGQTASHIYEHAGSYLIRLTVIDDRGAQDMAEEELVVREANEPPQAGFTFSPGRPTVDDVVQFTDRSRDPDGEIIRWSWDFGDGTGSALRNPSHQYGEPGDYTVTLTVTDDDGASATASAELHVTVNLPPVADFSFWPPEPTTQDEIRFTDQSSDPDGEIVSWWWDFGDGATSDVQSPSHRYPDDGTYTVRLQVRDDRGATAQTSQEIEVANVPPTASFSISPEEVETGDPVNFDASDSSDPDGEIIKYEWDFDGDGEFEESAESATITHAFNDNGTYTVTLRVTDDDGALATTQGMVRVLNRPPQVGFRIEPEEPSDLDLIQFIDTSSDADGEIISWWWDFGDGATSDTQSSSHRYLDDGRYIVTLTVTDDDGAEAQVSREVVVVNAPPQAAFSFTPEEPTVGDLIQFIDESYDPSPTGYIVFWGWDFGDGTSSTEQNPQHRYREPGTYTVTLTVIDEQGALARTSKELIVAPQP